MPHTELQVRSHRRGFTLIELMIVVAIIAILAMVAYPSYVEYVRRGHRAEAQTALLGAAQFMQRFYAANNRYDQDLSTNRVQLPIGSSITGYNLTVSATQTGFTLTATPNGVMSGDRCGNLTINQLGVRAVTGSGATVANCWK